MTGQCILENSGTGNLLMVKDQVFDNWQPGVYYTNYPTVDWSSFTPEQVPGYTIAGIWGHKMEAGTGVDASGSRYYATNLYTCFYDSSDGKIKVGFRDLSGKKTANLKLTFTLIYIKN